MAEHHLAIDLNDHLAGSEAALELLEHIDRAHAGDPAALFTSELRAAIHSRFNTSRYVSPSRRTAQTEPAT